MAFNTTSGLSMGIQGAQLGGKLGGPWGAVGGGLLGLIIGGSRRDPEVEMARKYNDQIVRYAAQDLFDLRREQNVENMRTAQALVSYQMQNKVQGSSIKAMTGAAEIIGSSAEALEQTIDYQTNQALATTMSNWETGIENYNTTVDRATNQRMSSLKRFRQSPTPDYGSVIGAGVSLYNSYGKGNGADMLQQIQDGWSTARTNLNEGWESINSPEKFMGRVQDIRSNLPTIFPRITSALGFLPKKTPQYEVVDTSQ